MVARAQRVYLRSSKAGGNAGGLQIRGARSGRDHGMGAMPRPDSRVRGNQARGSRHRATGPLPRLYATEPPSHPRPGAGECAHALERRALPIRLLGSTGRAAGRSLSPVSAPGRSALFGVPLPHPNVTKTRDGRTPTQSVNFKVARLRPSGETAGGLPSPRVKSQHPGGSAAT
jgi:hypothetical protein